ncbi:MAG: hypothetical protein WCS37_18060, partial [Chloroflexota bacterium]
MIVMKFGGTSVGSAERYQSVAKLVGGYREKQPVVVVSAMSGTTDWLLNTARTVSEGGRNLPEPINAERLIAEFRSRYKKVVEETITSPEIRVSLFALTALM